MTKHIEDPQTLQEAGLDLEATLSALEALACRCTVEWFPFVECATHSQLIRPIRNALLRGAKAIKLLDELAPAVAFSVSHTWGPEDFAEFRRLTKSRGESL